MAKWKTVIFLFSCCCMWKSILYSPETIMKRYQRCTTAQLSPAHSSGWMYLSCTVVASRMGTILKGGPKHKNSLSPFVAMMHSVFVFGSVSIKTCTVCIYSWLTFMAMEMRPNRLQWQTSRYYSTLVPPRAYTTADLKVPIIHCPPNCVSCTVYMITNL